MALERGPVTWTCPDGSRWTTEREVTRVDDWRDTIFGRVNFGYIRFGPMRMARLDSTAAAPAPSSDHVHLSPEAAPAHGRAPGDEAAG